MLHRFSTTWNLTLWKNLSSTADILHICCVTILCDSYNILINTSKTKHIKSYYYKITDRSDPVLTCS